MGNALRAASAAGLNASAATSSAIDLGNRRVEGGEEFVGIALREDQRRPDLDDVPEGAGIAGEETPVLELVDDLDRPLGIRLERAASLHHLHADEHPVAAHVADGGALLLAFDQRCLEAGADARHVLGQPIALDYVEHRPADRGPPGTLCE